MTYTNFNDIKIAEAQTDQAKQDLIQIQTEKRELKKPCLRSNQPKPNIQAEKMAASESSLLELHMRFKTHEFCQ
ncbi:MAG: hypothetical protein IPP42_01515 [Saprospiraceae bacterium]|nr:hypothetical protein [Saprospiraceae bacterium]